MSCPHGAQPTPTGAGIQVWVQAAQLPLEIISLLTAKVPWAIPSMAAQLVDIDAICASNPPLPDPLTTADILSQTAAAATAGAIGDPKVLEWIGDALNYVAFGQFCECLPPPIVPGLDCVALPATITTGNLGWVSEAFPVTLSPAVFNAIFVHPNGDWDWHRRGSMVVDGGAHMGNGVNLQYLANNGQWVLFDDIQTLNLTQQACSPRFMQASAARFNQTTAIRFQNQAGGIHTITSSSFCFCALPGVIAPLPPPQLDPDTPNAPTLVCDDTTICALLQELARRVTVIAAQISDIQAALGEEPEGELEELVSQAISGEGQMDLLSSAVMVRFRLPTLGPGVQIVPYGSPDRIRAAAVMRFGNDFGWQRRSSLDAQENVFAIPRDSQVVSWSLSPGTTGTVSQLKRLPPAV